ncbi:replication-associated polyprotein [Blackberry virus E]|uniref:Replication-associated polyprotein n=1 Tax=Blackberry virus E TaxID=1043184 RepID=F8VAF9_9VIRU|nr:replication-associated polyprotein [Blackberry virus E]AEI17897.1 replication-associated polyprotein [Blackberry virus E]
MATQVRRLLDQVSDPSTKAAYSELCFSRAKDAAAKAATLAPFAVSDAEAVTLERLGITTSPFATTSHTHAADKILENDCLALIGHYLPKDPVTFIQLKKSKLHLLHRGPDQDTLTNYCHEPKDVLRYGITNPHSCPKIQTQYAVLADTLHFMSTMQLAVLFNKNPTLDRLFATLVLPIEALHRLPSLFPEVYRLEYYENHFAYMPGGHGGGAYVHSYATLKWLSTGQVGTHGPGLISFGITDYLSIEKIETKAAHHVMLIQRRRARVPWPLPPVWVFQASDYVRLPHIFYPPEANVRNTYQDVFVKRLQAYCFSVKAVSLRDIFAKIRQVVETQELRRYSMADLIRLANFLLFTTAMQQVCDYQSFLTKGFLARLSARIQARIRSLTEGLMGQSSYAALLSVADTIPVPFTTKPISRPAQGEDWYHDPDEEGDEPEPENDSSTPSLEDLDLLAELGENPKATAPGTHENKTSNDPALERKDIEVPSSASPKPTRQPLLEHVISSEQDQDLTLDELEAMLKAKPPSTQDKGTVGHQMSDRVYIPHGEGTSSAPHNGTPEHGREHAGSDEHIQFGTIGEDDLLEDLLTPTPTSEVGTTNSTAQVQAPRAGPDPKANAEAHTLPKRTVDILRLHGFTNLNQQFSDVGAIQPVIYNTNAANLKLAPPPLSKLNKVLDTMAQKLQRRFYSYVLDNKRATAYMSDVKNNLTGLVLPKLDRNILSAWVSLAECSKRTVSVLVIHGAGGAGKSRAIQEMLRNHGEVADNTNVVVPTVNLVLDWKSKLPEVDPKHFMTFEKACEREGKEVVIFDDYGKLPAGYIDAYLSIKPTVETVILTGDQRQSVHHATNREAQTANLKTNVQHFSRYCDYYVNATHRQPQRLANPIQVHAERKTGGAVHRANLIPDTATVLVPSFTTQQSLNGLGRRALAYSGCQGLTLPHVTIVLDNDTPLCSNEVLYTAFSRAPESITFVNTHSDHPDFLAKLDSTPYLKTLLSGVREDEQAGKDDPLPKPEVREPMIKTHLPVANLETYLEDKVEQMEDKDTRELWDGKEKTNLMQTQDPVVQLFPHQQAKDEALFKLTIEQRIRTATPAENSKSVQHTLQAGDLLFEAYSDFMRVPKEPQTFNPDLWEHCKQLALRTYVSKPRNNLEQGKTRQDPDFPENAIALFNKSQWVKKLEKVGFKFKAGQTISAFKQSTVLLTTTMALYLRKKRLEHQPQNVFIMCEKTPAEFNDFVLNRWDFKTPSYTSDYTQYDQSQDAAFLNFELRKARHLGVPEEVLDFYKFIKIHAKTFVGNLAIMRLSGEGPTFDANTECNIAYDALRFKLAPTVNACYAGDDLVRDQVCDERPGWQLSKHLFTLQAKPLTTTTPDFCGWRLTPHGIVKSPIQLYQSLQLALRLNKMEEVKRSYAIDYSYAYKLGDKLHEVFNEQELDAHQLTTRIFVKKGLKIPETGDHLPQFNVVSDRLITNPHYKEMHDSTSDRTLLSEFEIQEDYVPDYIPRIIQI